MQLLHTCPVPNVEFASLSLLMDSTARSINNNNNGNKSSSDGESNKNNNDDHCPESFVDLTIVNSPLSTTPPSVTSQALTELHVTLASQSSIKSKAEPKVSNKKVTKKSAQGLKYQRHHSIGDAKYDDEHDLNGSVLSLNNFQNLCIEEEVAHRNNAPQSFRPMHSRNGLLLTYIAIHDERVVQQCASIFSPSYNSRPFILTEKPSQASYPLQKASLIICVGIIGMPYSYGMSPIIHSLPRRLVEFTGLLSRLKASINLLQANKQRQNLETMLTSIFIDDEYLKTNALVQLENGVTNITEGSKGTMTDVAIRKTKSNKFFASGMPVVKIPKKIGFVDRRRKKKHSKEKDDEPKFVPTALISSSLPSSDLSKIISSTYLILSLAEKDMALRPYQARMKRQTEYNLLRKGKGDQKMYKSPSRLSRKSGKIDMGLSGSDLAGFDYVPRRTKSDGSVASSTVVHSLGSESTCNTGLTSFDTASTTSIPTLSGPSRDSSASKIQYRRNKVAAASAANQYSKSWASSIGRSPRTAQASVRRTVVADDRKVRVRVSNNGVGQGNTNFDPFSLNGEGMASDTVSISTTSTEGKTTDGQRASQSLISGDRATLVSNHSVEPFATQNNAESQHAKEELNDATTRVKPVVNIAMNEDLSCLYCDSKLVSCLIEGMIQAQIKCDSSACAPFTLTLNDPHGHIRTVLENKKYANDISHELNRNVNEADAHYKYAVTLPKVNHYFPIVKYKCSNDLRPIPIRVESKVRANNVHCRVALQIMSNPSNETDLNELTILMAVPPTVHGGTLSTQPPGGVWNKEKGSVIWCVTELGPGQKFQLQAQFDLVEELVNDNELPQFPVLIKCQSMFTQLSNVKVEVCQFGDTAEVGMKLARRFRLSHREKQSTV